MRRKLTLASAVLGLALHVPAWALGLGQVQQRSALNEPLSARIPLSSVRAGELESMVVELAPAEAFRRVGMDRPFSLSRLQFEVVEEGGQPYIRVSTQQPVREPFLSFLVEVSWNRGRMLREYTLLLDPPVYASGTAPALRTAAVGSSAAPAEQAARQAAAASNGAASQAAASRQQGVTEVPSGGDGRYTVQANDTLWRVAGRVRPDDSVSVHQTMLALFRANPDAFIANDMNRLKSGSVLRVPAREDIAALGGAQAQSAVQQQIARWRAGQSAADSAPAAPAAPAEEGRLQIVAPAETGGEDAATALLDRDLVATPENLDRLQQQLSLSQEQNASLSAERDELEAQLGQLRQEVAELQRLVNLRMEQSMAAEAAAPASAAQPADAQLPATPAVAPEPAAAETQPEPAVAAETEARAEPTPAPKPAVVAPVEPSPVPSLWSDWRVLAGLGGALLGLLGVLYMMLRRRRQAAAAPVELGTIETVAEAPASGELAPAETTAEAVDAVAVAPAERPAETVSPESDVVSEAEVYLAYGRYDQARDVIAKAVADEPERRDLRLKLLEILALTHDRAGFENEAQGLFGLIGDAADPDWQKVARMGREIAPENPLFGAGKAPEPTVEAEPEADDLVVDLELPEGPGAEAQAPATPESPDEAPPAPLADLEFDLGGFGEEPEAAAPEGEAEPKTEPEPAASGDFSLDFDLGESQVLEPQSGAVAEPAAEPEPVAEADDDFAFDLDDSFSFDDDDGDLAVATAPAEAALAPAVASAPAAEDEALLEAGDEVDTKLDLAQAYLDMGDADGARELLSEVVEEGSGRQKQRAEGLLAQL